MMYGARPVRLLALQVKHFLKHMPRGQLQSGIANWLRMAFNVPPHSLDGPTLYTVLETRRIRPCYGSIPGQPA
jgi:hypothetical protein